VKNSLLLTGLFLFLSTGCLFAQTHVLTGGLDTDTIWLTARPGGVSATDTLIYENGRLGGRFFIYFNGPQRRYFQVDPALRPNWIGHKIKPHKTLRIPIVFSPPAGFTGEAHAEFEIQGLSGNPWVFAIVVGKSSE